MDPRSFLKRLVQTESPTAEKAAVDKVGALVANEAVRLGAEVQYIPVQNAGDHLIARWGKGNGGILLLCHMDTVFPLGTLKKMPYRDEGEKIFGPGVLDMKAGIVISLAAIESLVDSDDINRPITLLCTSDEEVGSLTSEALILELAQNSDLALVLEPAMPDGSLKVWRKGVGEFNLKVVGRAAHAGGAHQEGRNAIEELAHQVIAIQGMTDYEKGTTLNVGVVEGGTVSNVVPEQATAKVDVRVLQPGEWERIESAVTALMPKLEGTLLEITGSLNRPPMPFDEHAKATFEKAKSIAAEIGIELKADGSGGASDGNFVAQLGIPVLDGLGASGKGLHSNREYIIADSLEQRIKLLTALLKNW